MSETPGSGRTGRVDALPSEQRRAVESFVADWVSDERVPGAALAVVDGEEVVYAEGFGARDLAENVPATPETLFGVGSCSKSVAAAAVMQRVEAGDLALDDAVDEYLPHLADAPGDPVTLEELLTHTSGLPDDGIAGPLVTRRLGLGHVEVPLSGREDFRRHVQGAADRRVIDREPFLYYNSGYTMLGLIVEAVTGQPYADYVETHLLDPLGMARSTFDRAAFEAVEDRMTPYVEREESPVEAGFPFEPLIQAPGGLVSSVAELSRWVQFLAGDGTLDGERVLSPESVAAMRTPAATFGAYFDGRDVEYGYGLMCQNFLGDRLVGHAGSIGVSTAWFGHLEDAGLGVALACTTHPSAHPMDVGPAVLALLRGEAPADVVPHYRLQAALDAATGEYESYRRITTATVERVGGALRLDMDGGLGGTELVCTPTRVEDDRLVCTTVEGDGFETELRFELRASPTALFYERGRFTKVE